MEINRNNYESFFLLYADNELSDAEKTAVAIFVEENADLKEEFSQILQLQLPAAKFHFDKSTLVNAEDYISPLEEKLLLYLDNEAGDDLNQEITKLLGFDKEIAASFALLKKTKLAAGDEYVFNNKPVLYRHKAAKVYSFKYLRWAAAAILLGIGLFAGIKIKNSGRLFNKQLQNELVQNNNNSGSKNNNTKQQAKQSNTQVIYKKENTAITGDNNSSTKPEPVIEQSSFNVSNNKISTSVNNRVIANNTKQGKIKHPDFIQQQKITPSSQNNNEPALIAFNKPVEPNIQPGKNEGTIVNSNAAKNIIDENITPLKEQFAQAAIFKEIPEENNNDKILMMEENEVKSSKVGVFFRKLKRNVERRTNIKTSKSFKIANFEIAAN